ncbi:MAG TPA: Nif11-like leader peptide family natural product precursor [Actinoplanes sp.]|nr:Nif11-like leader peptide family natural product precursor [Actinoplanes sp.]
MNTAVIDFLRLLSGRPDLLDVLKVRNKDDVLAAAAAHGFTFTEAEFDECVWDAEMRLALRRGEAFDAHFPLWQTMWGRYYLEYLVADLVSSLEETGQVA